MRNEDAASTPAAKIAPVATHRRRSAAATADQGTIHARYWADATGASAIRTATADADGRPSGTVSGRRAERHQTATSATKVRIRRAQRAVSVIDPTRIVPSSNRAG